MSDLARHNKRLVLRYASVQLGCAAVVAIAFLLTAGIAQAAAVGVGGLIVAMGSVVFGWRLFAAGWPPPKVARGLYLGEVFKWIWMLGALSVALRFGAVAPFELIVGVIAAQFGFWIAMWFFK